MEIFQFAPLHLRGHLPSPLECKLKNFNLLNLTKLIYISYNLETNSLIMETLEQKLIRKRERHNEQSKLRMRKYRANNNLSVEKSVQFKKKDAERQKRK